MLFSCSSSSTDIDRVLKINCSPMSIEAPAKGGSYKITVVASEGGWEARASFPGEGPTANVYPWFKVSVSGNNKSTGMVTVDVEENKSSVALYGSVEISLGDKKVSVPVHQSGKTVTPIEGGEMVIPEGYKLVWNDEFNKGSELNSTDWRHEVQKAGWVNNELQNYVNGSADGKRVTEIADNRLYINCFKGSDGKIYSGRVYATKTKDGFTASSKLASNCLKVKVHGLLSG